MSQNNNNIEIRKGKHLTERERYQIEVLLKERIIPKEIAKRLGRHRRTIEREICRGMIWLLKTDLTYKQEYCADTAQMKYDENAKNKGPTLKIGYDHKLAQHIENRIIHDKYSPDAVIGEIKAKGLVFKTQICTKTVYNYIDKGIFLNITNKDLPVKRNKKKGGYKKIRIAYKNLKGTSIEERDEQINKREEYGHWEMDCVSGKQGGSGAVLLVLSERQSREEIIRKLSEKTQECVKRELDRLEKRHGRNFKSIFQTITVDNGGEFLDFERLENSVLKDGRKRTKLYYAHPYSSWERGTNENSNKLIRRFIPKGTDINKISKAGIERIEHWINNYPRRIFGYKTASEMSKVAC